MIIRGKEKWKEVIEAQKQSGLTIKKYCNDNPICISSFYKQKALILDEENTFLPVIIDKSMMLLILILTIIIFPVPNKISRFYWRTCYDYQYRWNQKYLCFQAVLWHEKTNWWSCFDCYISVRMNVLDHSLFIFTDFSPSYIWLRRIIMSV